MTTRLMCVCVCGWIHLDARLRSGGRPFEGAVCALLQDPRAHGGRRKARKANGTTIVPIIVHPACQLAEGMPSGSV